MKKHLLVVVVTLITTNGINGMDQNKSLPSYQEATQILEEKMKAPNVLETHGGIVFVEFNPDANDRSTENEKLSDCKNISPQELPELQWKQKRNQENQQLARLKQSLENTKNKKEMHCAHSLYNWFSYSFHNKAYNLVLNFWKEQEQESINRIKVILTKHTEEDLEHEKDLFEKHLEVVQSEISQLDAKIKEKPKTTLSEQQAMDKNKNIVEHANLVAQRMRLVEEQSLLSNSNAQHYKMFYRSHTQKSYRDLLSKE